MTTNTDACKAVIDAQAAKGLSKYGVALDRADVTLSDLAEHGAQEAADLLAYMVELKRRAEAMQEVVDAARKLTGCFSAGAWDAVVSAIIKLDGAQ